MKKALKLFMLALLVVPCAFVFTACGTKMKESDFNQYIYDAQIKQVKDELSSQTYGDIKVESSSSMSTSSTKDYTYYAKETDLTKTTKAHTSTVNATANATYERHGSGGTTVVKLTIHGTTDTVTHQVVEVDVEDVLNRTKADVLKSTETKTTTDVVYYLGQAGVGVERTFYVVKTGKTTVETIDLSANKTDEKAEAAEPAVTEYKDYQKIAVSDVETVCEKIYNTFIQSAYAMAVQPTSAELPITKSYTKDGSKVTAKIGFENALLEGGLYNYSNTINFKDEKVASVETSMDGRTEDPAAKTRENMMLSSNYSIAYASDAIALPAFLDNEEFKLVEDNALTTELSNLSFVLTIADFF